MIQLGENEKIIVAVHRHWIVIGRKMTLVIFLLIPLIGILIFVSRAPQEFIGLILYALVLYFLFVIFLAFRLWIDYYLDMWILTDKRLIDIEQTGLFQRNIFEIRHNRRSNGGRKRFSYSRYFKSLRNQRFNNEPNSKNRN